MENTRYKQLTRLTGAQGVDPFNKMHYPGKKIALYKQLVMN